MRVVVEAEERPVVERVQLQHLLAWLRERPLGIAAVQVADVLALELELGDGLGERNWVLVVDALPCQRVEEELVVQEQLLLHLRDGL